MDRSYYHDVVCPQCHARTTESPDQLLARLRQAGVLRRAKNPEAVEIFELAKANAPQLACTECGHIGVAIEQPLRTDDDDAEAWGDPKPCERCGALIPAERLELFPSTTLCMKCQQASERGEDTGPAEYCPRCGNILVLRKARGDGIARYVMECPACRK